MEITELLKYSFVQRAFLAGSFVALSCSFLGIFLVIRKMSLLGDGLAHVSFGAIAIGLYTGIYPFYFALPIVIIASILVLKISEKAKIYGDAAIGIVSASGISLGVIFASKSNGFNADLFSYLFGNILSIGKLELVLSILLSMIVLATVFLLYHQLFSATFDEEYAKTTGVRTELINVILTVLSAITVLLSVKVVGVMLVSALLILPAVSALQVAKKFQIAILASGLFSVFSVIAGITFSLLLNFPPGATIVLVSIFIFILALIYKKIS